MAFPSNPARRKNRRRAARNQQPAVNYIPCTVTGSGSTVTLTFAEPINVAGQIPINVATLTRSTQTVVSPTVVTVLMSGALTGHAWTLASPVPETSTYTGGVVLGGSGTF